ncbi:hypothetical protein CDD81_7862 [Ophiocordyceps australis]|uniref:AA1-like domain-containing protein n=1 Tax=Ophiocordyceps australis TaxID=1399860 RepID=A0A2C5XBL5_9HYPO|nr:hypothetical protein CDD81_7862 [Ophiocordyceps australis]
MLAPIVLTLSACFPAVMAVEPKVTLYEFFNYQGRSRSDVPKNNQCLDLVSFNDKAESIQLNKEAGECAFFMNFGCEGVSFTTNANVDSVGTLDQSFFKKISSYKCTGVVNTGPEPVITLYEFVNFGGREQQLAAPDGKCGKAALIVFKR